MLSLIGLIVTLNTIIICATFYRCALHKNAAIIAMTRLQCEQLSHTEDRERY